MQEDGFTTKLSGNLVADAVQRFTANGKAVVNFKMGTKNGFGEYEKNWFPQITVWGKDAENEWLLKNLYKGREVTVVGTLDSIKPWGDNNENYNIGVNCTMWRLHGKGNASNESVVEDEPEDDEVPF